MYVRHRNNPCPLTRTRYARNPCVEDLFIQPCRIFLTFAVPSVGVTGVVPDAENRRGTSLTLRNVHIVRDKYMHLLLSKARFATVVVYFVKCKPETA